MKKLFNPVVEIHCGRIRGYLDGDIYTFLGLPYARAERFMAPKLLDSWTEAGCAAPNVDSDGVYQAFDYGYISPTPFVLQRDIPVWGKFTLPQRFLMENEQCQFLNVWAPADAAGKRLPVMFWIHGGGFYAGASTDLYAYDGKELSDFGNVVVVSVNHRLNVLGFLDLSKHGEKYRDSANVGMLDIVAALQWVHLNIEAFGGNPDNVTLFGQSGGGGKITALLQMPAADGLYHKVIVQSGVAEEMFSSGKKEESGKRASEILRELGVDRNKIDELQKISCRELEEVANRVEKRLTGATFAINWAPTPDYNYAGTAADVGNRKETLQIPMVIGTNLCEFEKSPIGEKAEPENTALREAFAESYPEIPTAYAVCVDKMFRVPSIRYIEKRIADGAASIYNYIFTFESAHLGGMMIGHSAEIAFVFHAAHKSPAVRKEDVTESLQNQMSGAWVKFAYTGNPNHEEIPTWTPCGTKHSCMSFGDVTVLKEGNFDERLLKLLP